MATKLVNKTVCIMIVVLYAFSNDVAAPMTMDSGSRGDGQDDEMRWSAPIEVFVVPHSHMDVGWVYTVQESMDAYVIDVYNTVVDSLTKNASRRFIAVEQEFFRRWWNNNATSIRKSQVHQLVRSGQLEFIIGGQVMNDEAVTEYSAIIQQMTEGNSFIYETFGVRPRFSWQIDPFGASAATPTLFAMMGFNAHLIDRIDYDKKKSMMQNKGLQFVWQASPSQGAKQEIFTHVMDSYAYCMPGTLPNGTGFFWNGYVEFPKPPNGHHPHMDTPVNASTVNQIAQYMVSNIKERADWFATNHLLWPWGCDKQFFNATVMFDNMDLLMDHINSHTTQYGVKLRYATVADYFEAIHDANHTWDVKKDGDYLPYSSDFDAAWTGFYASHGSLKGLARSAQSTLHAAEGLFAIYNHQNDNFHPTLNKTNVLNTLKALREASAEVQHHDAITGTMSPEVYNMYHTHLVSSQNQTAHVMVKMIEDMMGMGGMESGIKLATASSQEGQDILHNADGKAMVPIVAYNPLGWEVRRLMPVNVSSPNVSVIDKHGRSVGSQVNPPLMPNDPYRLFIYVQLPPLTYDTYFIVYNPTRNASPLGSIQQNPAKHGTKETDNHTDKEETVAISNDCFVVTYDNKTNMMMSITDKNSGTVISMRQIFMEYNAHHDVMFGQETSNYVMRPMGEAHAVGDMVKLDVITGPYVSETVQSFYNFYDPDNSRYTVTLRLHDLPHSHEDDIVCGHIELDFRIGPLHVNKELIYRFKTHLTSSKIVYTDVNGYQTMKREHKIDATEPVSQNYFPMVSRAYIQDEEQDIRLTLLSERSHGVSSLDDGEMEVLLHRRIINNDWLSYNYNLTLNDTSVVTPSLWLLLGNRTKSSQLQHEAWLQLENPPHMLVVNESLWDDTFSKEKAASSKQSTKKSLKELPPRLLSLVPVFEKLPPNLHLLTLQIPGWTFDTNHSLHVQELTAKVAQENSSCTPIAPNLDRVLLRLHHVFEKDEHPELSQPASVDLADFLSPLGEIDSIEERSLNTIWPAKDVKRWTWNTRRETGPPSSNSVNINNRSDERKTYQETNQDSTIITLQPQEIKTFFITFQKN